MIRKKCKVLFRRLFCLTYLKFFQKEDIIQEIGKHSDYNMECGEVSPCRKKYGLSPAAYGCIFKEGSNNYE